MYPRRGRLVAVGTLLVVLLATITLVAAPRPPPQPLCDVCTDDVIAGSDVESSTVTIQLDEDGDGHWTVTLDPRANANVSRSAVWSAAENALHGHRGEAQPRNLSVNTSANAVVVTYDVPRMGHRSLGGVLVADYFHSQGEGSRWYAVNADRLVITGPVGDTLARAPAKHRLNETAIALDGTYGDSFERTISPGWYLAFAEDRGVFTSIAAQLAVSVDVAQLKGTAVPKTVAVPTVLLAGCLALRNRLRDVVADASKTRILASIGVIAGLGVASGLALGLDGATFTLLLSASVLAPILALSAVLIGVQYALLTRQFGVDVDTRWLVRSGVAVAVVALIAAPLVAGQLGPIASGYGSAVAVVTATLFVPLALTEQRSEQWLLTGVILLSPLLVAVGWAPYGSYGDMYAPAIFAFWALITAALGMVAYMIGRSKNSPRPPAQ
ncbi:hypothetical protein [Halorhabdus sp. CUG00001]|uniref:hypothetical protein n=1 Tax=Halorhabdus sp. CUG00001 TaxID=2600297 RepID=UPI00131AC24E|nr:hypothetical protein [Halorhabdus sp. CUG00001]